MATAPFALKVSVYNYGDDPWTDYSMNLEMNYFVGQNWPTAKHVTSHWYFRNCISFATPTVGPISLSCRPPIYPKDHGTVDFVNQSKANLFIEFPEQALVQETENGPYVPATVRLGGFMLGNSNRGMFLSPYAPATKKH